MGLKEHSDEELREELARRKKLNRIPLERKNIDFSDVIVEIRGIVKRIAEGKSYVDEDDMQMVFEAAIECMYDSDEFWEWWGKNVKH